MSKNPHSQAPLRGGSNNVTVASRSSVLDSASKAGTPTATPAPTPFTSPTAHIGSLNLPAGRTLADMPKGGPIPVPTGVAKPANSRLTLKQLITENDSKEYLIPFLKELGLKRKKGPWRGYLEFYIANHSGDMDSMNGANRSYCERMVKELNDEYFEGQQL